MIDRTEFARHLAGLALSHAERSIAFLYYYRASQAFDERTASSLAADLHEEGFPRPNVTRLHEDLTRSRYTTRASQKDCFQLDLRRVAEFDHLYAEVLKIHKIKVQGRVIPTDWLAGTRPYLEQMTHQINAAYELGLYDAWRGFVPETDGIADYRNVHPR